MGVIAHAIAVTCVTSEIVVTHVTIVATCIARAVRGTLKITATRRNLSTATIANKVRTLQFVGKGCCTYAFQAAQFVDREGLHNFL